MSSQQHALAAMWILNVFIAQIKNVKQRFMIAFRQYFSNELSSKTRAAPWKFLMPAPISKIQNFHGTAFSKTP